MTREAFDREVGQHRRRWLLLATRITGNHDDAEDVVQCALIDAWRKIEEGAIIRSFPSYVNKMCEFRALTVLKNRKRKRYEEVSYEEWGQENENVASLTDDYPLTTEVILIRACERGQAQRAILALADRAGVSNKMLTRLWQKAYYGMSGPEIAAIDGAAPTSINKGVCIAMEQIRQAAKGDEFNAPFGR